ncbi:hypothetical protein M4D49_28330 [Cupriavidus pauculus]|uniref:hypothetical protein n=1 Tax=Cupriavidus TaxID=106589 RepID=UPI00203F9592|nr:hypothetical protein [Cupriavidus pauculus]MCM3609396.1 hypothetical protein [Cupriavidus pauculus]
MTKTLENSDAQWLAELDRALPEANVPTLLMVLLHLTGDRRWLAQRYQCTQIKGIDDHDSGGLSADIQQEVRAAARDALHAWNVREHEIRWMREHGN